jgi:hypothetical protein
VNELINPVLGTWDEVLVRQTFVQADAEIILRIPICENEEDHLAWHFDEKGRFSVKSAYKVHSVATSDLRQAGSSEGTRGSPWRSSIWRRLWNLDCPPKVHHFLWRLGHDSLATRRNIERKHVELDTRCAICNRLFEDSAHLFLRCSELKKVWRTVLPEQLRVKLLDCNSSLELLHEIFSLKYEEMMTTIALFWCWWTERNKANHKEKRLSVEELQFTVKRYTGEWAEYFKSKHTSSTLPIQKWQPTDIDWVMINTDGDFQALSGIGGWGCIARNHESQPIFAAAGNVTNAGEALATETQALLLFQ